MWEMGLKTIVQASFNSLFLGGIDKLVLLMNESFLELGFQVEKCTEMNWIQSILFFLMDFKQVIP